MTLKSFDILQPVLLRVCLSLVGLSSLLRSRMEVSSPPTSFDHIQDISFLLESGTDPSSLPYFPAILLPFYEGTGAKVLPAVLLGAFADGISGCALYYLALNLNFPTTQAVDVMTMFLWNPLSIASCVSGSTDPLRLCAIFAAAASAAAGTSLARAGACLALALHFGSTWHLLLMSIPLIMLSLRKNTKTTRSSRPSDATHATTTTTTRAAFTFLAGLIVTSAMLTIASLYLIHNKSPTVSTTMNMRHSCRREEAQPWSNIEPNVGLQWYLFAEVLPPFRYLYEYIFWALPAALCLSIALRFGQQSPLGVLVAQGIVLCMLSRHPTYSDIMLWLGALPLVLLSLQKEGQNEKNKKRPSKHEAAGKHGKMWLAVGFCICLGLNTAAYELWLTLGTGNANFFYGMNLAWAAWQALALVHLLKSTSALEEDA